MQVPQHNADAMTSASNVGLFANRIVHGLINGQSEELVFQSLEDMLFHVSQLRHHLEKFKEYGYKMPDESRDVYFKLVNFPFTQKRDLHIEGFLQNTDVWDWVVTKEGFPRHPLYVPASRQLTPFALERTVIQKK
jgi:hypothetical protein